MNDPLLQVTNLTTRLGSEERAVRVVDGVELEVRRGETFALLGEGCNPSYSHLTR